MWIILSYLGVDISLREMRIYASLILREIMGYSQDIVQKLKAYEC